MSVLPPEVHAELAQLLDALQSSDNSVRAQAEEHLANNWTATKPDMLLMGLVEQIQGSNDATVGDAPSICVLGHFGIILTSFLLTDAFLRCCHFPPGCLQVAQAPKRSERRAFPFLAAGASLCHPTKAPRGPRRRVHEQRAEQDW